MMKTGRPLTSRGDHLPDKEFEVKAVTGRWTKLGLGIARDRENSGDFLVVAVRWWMEEGWACRERVHCPPLPCCDDFGVGKHFCG